MVDFHKQLRENCEKGLALIKVKNKDYGKAHDPFANFRLATLVGVSVERAILVRVSDKLARISNLLEKKNDVKDETIEDSVLDAMNYLNILLTYLKK